MFIRSMIFAASIGVGALAASTANAVPGWATGNVNMRTCGSTSCGKITTIPAGAQVDIISCGGWCELIYAGQRGFASANYIRQGGGGGYTPVQPIYPPAPAPVQPVYPVPLPPAVYWQYGRPWWDDRYRTWYDGHGWWYDGRWHRRPPGGFTFEFRF